MKMVYWTKDIPEPAQVIACVGFFDGVHLGHQELFRVARSRAEACGGVTVVVTFEPHPVTLVSEGSVGPVQVRPVQEEKAPGLPTPTMSRLAGPKGDIRGTSGTSGTSALSKAPRRGTDGGGLEGAFSLLTPLEEKARLIESVGMDYLRVIPFTPELMRTEPREFARLFLAEQLGARVVVVGFNFTFGFRASGKAQHLVEFGRELGFEAIIVPPVVRRGEVVSSTAIRRALVEGDVEKAMEFLGRPYSVEGVVVHGDGRGRSLGFPTANLDVHPQKLLPAPGVYACRVYPGSSSRLERAGSDGAVVLPGKRDPVRSDPRSEALEQDLGLDLPRRTALANAGTGPTFTGRVAVANIGTCPTFGERHLHLEVHIPAWSGNLYGEELRVEFLRRLRDEKKFASPEELREQVARDISDVIESQR